MTFLKPTSKPWHPDDFSYTSIEGVGIRAAVLHILCTTALVESRADQYSDYLRAVFASRGTQWSSAIDIWNHEERQHGETLRRLCEAADPRFEFASSMRIYLATTNYHACDGRSVRGSIANELIARCVVEALASTFYRALHDAIVDPTSRQILHTLAQDEARHYGMFRKLLAAEQNANGRVGRWQRLRVGLGRMFELSDDQIMRAAWAVSIPSGTPYRRNRVAQAYAAALYPHYRLHHLRYAARMLGPTMLGTTAPLACTAIATGLWIGVRLRRLFATLGVSSRANIESAIR